MVTLFEVIKRPKSVAFNAVNGILKLTCYIQTECASETSTYIPIQSREGGIKSKLVLRLALTFDLQNNTKK